jgi:hypothetical protein
MRASQQFTRLFVGSLVILSALAAMAPQAAAQNPVPALSITISPGDRTAEITASQPAAVTFAGNYSVDKLAFERAVVTIQGSVSTGWPVTISPATITISGNANLRGTFLVTVVVPPGELATNIAQLSITGRATAGGLQSVPAVASAIIKPQAYFRTVVASDLPFIESPYSTQVTMSFKVFNEGNVRDTIRINVKNLDELSEQQWIVQLTRSSFIIDPPPGQQAIQLTIGLPKKWTFYPDNKVTQVQVAAVSVEGASNGQPYEDSIPVFVRTVGVSTPGFDVPLAIMGTLVAAMVAGAAHGPRRKFHR